MMASKNGVGQIIKACVTGVTLIALPGGFRIIKAALDDLFGFTRWTCDAVWPAQLAYSLITLTIIDQILDVNLHRWTPVRVWDMGWYQCTPSSKSTTLESNMSLHANHPKIKRAFEREKPFGKTVGFSNYWWDRGLGWKRLWTGKFEYFDHTRC